MKNIIYLLVFVCISVTAQDKYLTKTGIIEFEASVPSFEEVKAKSNSVTAIINTENGEFAALVLIKSFRFKNALMEEHFNENYAESDFYSKSKLKGKIADFSIDKLSESSTKLYFNGELEFHGKTKILDDIEFDISMQNNVITISGEFLANASTLRIPVDSNVSYLGFRSPRTLLKSTD